ncbi:MAG: GNAT family N-acetyltransferase [Ignavibacteria bacterium]|nr:GNAT family N-acetyltransferase [Ignavibacteria bacterium]
MSDTISTERLHLRKLNAGDADFALKLLNTEGWLKYIGDRGVRSVEDAEKYLRSGVLALYEQHGFGPYGVSLSGSDQLIGFSGLFKRDFLEFPDIGFAFLPEHCGKGYAFESSEAVLNEARNNLKLRKLLAITRKDNFSSAKLLAKLGMSFERMTAYPGETEELMLYSISLNN